MFRPSMMMPILWSAVLVGFVIFVCFDERDRAAKEYRPFKVGEPLTIGGVGVVSLVLYYARQFAFCENGIRVKTPFGTRRILVPDIITHSWDAMPSEKKVSSVKMTFWVRGGLPVVFFGEVNKSMQKLDSAELQFSESIADRLEKRIRDEGVVKVGKGWYLSETGVRTRSGDAPEIPYSKLSHFSLNDGRFALFAKGKQKPIVTTTSWQYGFSPALCCLLRFWKPDTSKQFH